MHNITNESDILTNETTGHTTRLILSNRQTKNFKKTSRNGARGNSIINIQQDDRPSIMGIKTVAVLKERVGSLSNHDDDGNKNPTNLHIWQWKPEFLHALHVHFSSFDILKTFSFFLRREMTCFAVVWTTWAYDDKILTLSRPRGSPLTSKIVWR